MVQEMESWRSIIKTNRADTTQDGFITSQTLNTADLQQRLVRPASLPRSPARFLSFFHISPRVSTTLANVHIQAPRTTTHDGTLLVLSCNAYIIIGKRIPTAAFVLVQDARVVVGDGLLVETAVGRARLDLSAGHEQRGSRECCADARDDRLEDVVCGGVDGEGA